MAATATYELIGSPQGTTLAPRHVDGVPSAQYRFKRVAHTLDEFTAISDLMQVDPDGHWHRKRFATRLLDGGPDRVTLTHDSLKIVRQGQTAEETGAPSDRTRSSTSGSRSPSMTPTSPD